MNNRFSFASIGLAAAVAVAGSIALAQSQSPPKDREKPTAPKKAPSDPASKPPGGAGEWTPPPPPPGWTEQEWMEHFQACEAAATTGPNHAFLADAVGVWNGKNTMWMYPGAEPMNSECVTTVTPIMDGRFTKAETRGDMPGMGPFNGFGIYGFDNVSEKFQSTWIDNCGTGMMQGTGELSSDGTTLTWNYTYNCPTTKKPHPFRIVETHKSKDSSTLEMYTKDIKSGKEYKLMQIDYTRKPGVTRSATAPGAH